MDEATHKKNFKPINIRDLFMAKNPKAGRWIPGFIYRLLSRMLRIDFMNDPILYNHGYKKDVDFARASIEVFNVSLDVRGREHPPREGRFIFVANHPLGGFDGMMIIRDFLGIKTKLEMFFLPSESYKHRNKHSVITFGKAIPYQTFDKRFSPLQWAARVKDYTYSLVENPEGEFSDINN